MRKGRALAVLFLVLASLGANLTLARARARAQHSSTTVLSLKLNGVVDPFMASHVQRGIDRATAEGDAAVLLTIDTPGGLDSSMRSIVKAILGSKVPVICYTAPSGARAASAGTFIMLACPVNAMAPGTEIGAAHPVGVSGVIENEKVTNDAAAFIRSLATRWNRNADWAEKAVRDAVSASAEDAQRLHVIDFVASSQGALFNALVARCSRNGIVGVACPRADLAAAPVQPFGMSVGEQLFHAIADPNVAFLLINIGFLALIVWVFHPGFHVSLAVGIVCMVIGLTILETLPVRLTGLILLAVSAVLFVLDVKAKAHGVLTAGGVATLVLGGLLLFNPNVPTAHVSRPLIVIVAAGAGAFAMFTLRALFAAKDLPVRTGREALEGSFGVATTALAPRGLVRARGETWTAECLGSPIPAGSPVRVVRVQGVKLLVEDVSGATVPAVGAPREGEVR